MTSGALLWEVAVLDSATSCGIILMAIVTSVIFPPFFKLSASRSVAPAGGGKDSRT